MGYDVDIVDSEGTSTFESNHTRNCAHMWDLAMPALNLRDMGGKSVEECIPHLEGAVAFFPDNESHLREFEPSNGWGSYESAFRFLGNLLQGCRENPGGTLRVST